MKERILTKVINELKKMKKVKALYLFGSYAKGEQKAISDIDICVITDRDISLEEKAEIVSHSSDLLDVCVFWDLPVAIRYNVLRGKCIFNRDESFLFDVESSTVLEYLELKPMIERFTKLYLGV